MPNLLQCSYSAEYNTFRASLFYKVFQSRTPTSSPPVIPISISSHSFTAAIRWTLLGLGKWDGYEKCRIIASSLFSHLPFLILLPFFLFLSLLLLKSNKCNISTRWSGLLLNVRLLQTVHGKAMVNHKERSGIPWNIWHRLRCSLHQTLRSGQACAMRTGVPHWPCWKKPSKGTSVSKNGTKIIIRSEQSTSACRNLTWNILHWPRASRRTMAATSWRSDRWGENLGWNPTYKSGFI